MGSMAFDLYNFKWEASPGLEHHCGICSKGLSNPRSVNSCIGVHCEPCRRYHQQLHFIQKAHECKSCIRADEMHHRRHRSIAKLVKDIEAHDREVATRAIRTKTKSARATPGIGHDEYIWQGGMSKTANDNVENLDPTKSVNDEEPDYDDAYDDDVFGERETEPFITMPNSTTHIPTPSTPKPCSSISSFGYESSPVISAKKKDLKKARRTARLTNNNSQSIVSNDFLEFIAEALHGSKIMDISRAMFEEEGEEIGANQFKNEDLMRENLGFQTFTRNSSDVRHIKDRWRKLGPGGKAQELAGPPPTAPGFPKPKFININETTRFDVNFFARLGVKYESKGDTSRARSEIVLKLAIKILEDMTIIGREEYETQIREAGFWRFISRAAAENLQQGHQDFSWATGEFRKRRRPGMLSDGNAETGLGINATGEPGLGAGDELGEVIQDNENDSSDDSVPGTPSLVGSAFETQAEEEKETPQMKTPLVLKFSNFDSGKKELLWSATPSKVFSSPKILPLVEPKALSTPKVSSQPKLLSPPEVLFSPKLSFSPKVSSTAQASFSPKASSMSKALLSPKVSPSPKTLAPPSAWSSLKQKKMRPTTPIANHGNQKHPDAMNSFRLVKVEKKHVAVQLKHESPCKLCGDQSAPTSDPALLETDDEDIWEVVRPSLPNVRAKNPYDLLSTVEEGSDKEDSSSEEGSGEN
ncbi:hypothetical protein VC83_06685 [Pseudogymnoascus destructans]|uniref:Uncharacterized protein n=2 Tax=Pseudogymnoascus destructans TaxID=655981 RepID=L8G878_PSED2|nr:uncharacterized protein VC83_06685 [Pseudogymnoascus destructans]ELR09297.1 hypothetical protein GMDG_03865 [Pseudogymnoascus destructans 20631-21]OAF56416.1 hypothetical protein VC83_06685 [Pseudogymnoascus destructans]